MVLHGLIGGGNEVFILDGHLCLLGIVLDLMLIYERDDSAADYEHLSSLQVHSFSEAKRIVKQAVDRGPENVAQSVGGLVQAARHLYVVLFGRTDQQRARSRPLKRGGQAQHET